MRLPAKSSIHWKLLLIIMLTSGTILLLYSIILFSNSFTHSRRLLIEELTTLANVIGRSSASALLFRDEDEAARNVAALAGNPGVDCAVLFDARGEPFATYPRDNPPEQLLPSELAPDTFRIENKHLRLFQTVYLDGKPIGLVYVSYNLKSFRQQVAVYAGISGMLFLLALLVGWLISHPLATLVSRPFLALAETTRQILEKKDYTLRAKGGGDDEIGMVIRSFNQMIEEVDRSGRALSESEERFRALIEKSSEGLLIVDANHTITYASPSSSAILGRSPGEVTGRRHTANVHPDDLPRAEETFARLARDPQGTTVGLALRVRHRDGTWRHTEGNATNLLDTPAVGGIVILFRDITKRVAAEEALRRSEERFRALIEKSSEGVMIVDPDRTVIYASPSISAIVGRRPEEVVGKALSANIHPDDLTHARAAFARLLCDPKGSVFNLAVRIRHSDGTWRYTEGNATNLIGTPAINGVVVHFRDVTDRVATQEALRQSEERFRALIEKSSEGVLVIGRDGLIVYASPALAHIVGRRPGDSVGRSLMLNVHPDDADRARETFEQIVRGPQGQISRLALRIRHADGTWRHVDGNATNLLETPAVHGVVIHFRDTSDRVAAEEALRRSEERFRALIEKSSEGLFVVDPEGRISYVSPSITRILGYSQEEFLGTGLMDKVHPDDMALATDAFRERMEAPGTVGALRVRVQHNNGSWRDIEGVATNLADNPAGRGVIINFRDVTEKVAAEAALRDSEERYRTLVETAGEGIVILQDGLVRFANSHAAAMVGRTVEELVESPYSSFVPPGLMPRMNENYRRRVAGEPIPTTYETYLQDRTGRMLPVEITPTRIQHGQAKPAVLVIIRDITERKEVELQLKAYQEQLQALASQLVLAEEKERRQLAVDLHDTIGQSLAMAKIRLDELKALGACPDHAKDMNLIHDLVSSAVQHSRSLTFQLSPPILYELGLEAALDSLVEQMRSAHGIPIAFVDDGLSKPLDEGLRVLVFRAVRELLINVMKHSKARHARVEVARDGDRLRVTVADDGTGFDKTQELAYGARATFGLFSIRERLRGVGGLVEIESRRGKGTRVVVSVPLREAAQGRET